MMSTWTTGLNLSDLAASHLKQSGVTAFSFLPSNNSDSYSSPSASNARTGGDKSQGNAAEIHFDEFDGFFNEEDDFDMDFSCLNDSISFAISTQVEPKASAFGCVICGEFDTGKKSTVGILSDQTIFEYDAQILLNEKPSSTKTHNPTLFHKPKHVSIVQFDFSTLSPDDIIIAKQKATL